MNSMHATTDRSLPRSSQHGPTETKGVLDGMNLAQWKSPSAVTRKRGTGRRHSISLQAIAEITAQLSIMSKSGIDVATALGSLASQSQVPALAEVLEDVHQSVLAGNTLSDGLRRHPQAFDAAFVATVAAGEASGSLAEVLAQLARMQRNELRTRRTMRTLLTYPILLLVVSLSVIAALVVFVLPRFADIFSQYDVALPFITQALISVAAELQGRWWLWLPVTLGLIGSFIVWRKSAAGRQTLDRLWLNAAVVKTICRASMTGRACRLFGMMLSNGVPILESLQLTRNAMTNSLFRKLMQDLEESVVNGRTMASVLKNADIIPVSARDMLITAEDTGNVADVSNLLGEYYAEEAEARMRHLIGLIEPILTVGMGVIVAIVVLAVMLPVFDLSSLAHAG